MHIRSLTLCAVFSALLCVGAWIGIPLGDTVITMQTFSVFLALLLLGGKRGFVVCTVYLLLGAAGLPVFSGLRGGVGMLLGVTGGYLWGFLAMALIYSLCGKRHMLGLILGLLACYTCGTLWFWQIYLDTDVPMALGAVVLKCVVPYLLPDMLKLALAWFLAKRLKPFITLPSQA